MSDEQKPQGRTAPEDSGPRNPALRFLSWKSTKQGFVYYDKTIETGDKNVTIPLPFTFIPLAKAVCIRGYHEPESTSYISNEVPSRPNTSKTEIFHVRGYNNITKKNHLAFSGTWEQIKKQCDAVDATWTESIYIGVKNPTTGKLEIANLQLNGSGITHWFDFCRDNNIWTNAVQVKSMSDEKKGSNHYKAPVFNAIKIKPETDAEAAILQKEVNEFLAAYFKRNIQPPAAGQQNTTPANDPMPSNNPAPTNNPPAQTTTKVENNQFGGITTTITAADLDDELPF